MRPAGLWRRAAAWSLDAALVALPVLMLLQGRLRASAAALAEAWGGLADAVAQRMVAAIVDMAPTSAPGPGDLLRLALALMRDPALAAGAASLQGALLGLVAPPLAMFVTLFLAWSLGFERSRLRATPGKRALGLHVAAADGSEATTGALLLRFLSGALSWLSLNLGHAMAAAPPRHAALHDRISRTRVLLDASAPARMPAWAWIWLAALAVAGLAATAWLVLQMSATLQAALDRAFWS